MRGPPPGEVYVHGGTLGVPRPDLGGVLVTVQPPRGFGSDPIGAYHAPDAAPPLPSVLPLGGRGLGRRRHGPRGQARHAGVVARQGQRPVVGLLPDAALGDLPLVYPFVVNDPGEGTQAKRRAHAVLVDHLVPPMTRAESTDDLARIETLLDAYAGAQAMDPGKLPALRRQVWDVLVDAEIHRDLGLADGVGEDEFDDMVPTSTATCAP